MKPEDDDGLGAVIFIILLGLIMLSIYLFNL